MEIFKFASNLRLRHPSMDPDLITAALGVKPRNIWCVGQENRQRDGTKIGSGVRDHSYWGSFPKRGEDSELLTVLDSDLTWLEQKRAFINNFIDSSGRCEYYISWFASDRSGGDRLSWSLLKRLADLRIDLSLDVYSERPDGPEAIGKTPITE